ncbi:MAG TPA: RNA polymerase sigma factor [Candidatus Bathyarchaeia archaeon]|nr:RNA polymerase sigma factor [Candidatus Bathyarchaeia archaeon]
MKTKTLTEMLRKPKQAGAHQVGSVCPCELSEFCGRQSDQEIVQYVRENKECYRLLIERYQDKLARYVRRISGVSSESVEDIVQDVFLKVYVNLNGYDAAKPFSSWIYRIAHNETINYWRKNKRKNDLVVSMDSESALGNIRDGRDVEKEVFGKINGRLALNALANVNERYRDALVMNHIEEASYREISEKLDIPIGTVGTLISRGKKILREHLERGGFSSEAMAS